MSDQLAEIEARWSVPPLADPVLVAVTAQQDIAWLVDEVGRLRTALGWYDGEVVLNPGPRVAREALGLEPGGAL